MQRALVVTTTACLVAALAIGPAPTSPAPPASAAIRYLDPTFAIDVQRDVRYGTATAADGSEVVLLLDLYLPRGDVEMHRPVFVFAHGGYFVTGSKDTTTVWATRMAQRGYVAASIDYRLASAPVIAPVDTEAEIRAVNDARADMQTAVRWFRVHAGELRIDPDRIAVGGSSAGAVTALGVAIGADAPLPGDHDEVSSAVCTAVSFSGANDPAAVGADDAGAIFHHGSFDTVVPIAQAVETRDAMAAVGLPVAWYEYPDGHDASDASLAARIAPTIEWLYDRVATAPWPCSPAVARQPRVPAGGLTPITGEPDRSGVVSLVSVDNRSPGYVQALPCSEPAGASSNLNTDAAGQIRSVLAVVRFGADGRACVFNQTATHVVADLQGWFADGAFDDVADERLLDTRAGAAPGDGSTTVIHGRPDATGVVSVVATETSAAGYLQVLACGEQPGAASNLNVDGAAQTRAGLAFVRFGGDGTACVFTQRSAHLVVDLQGYLAPASFDDLTDVRLLDTRSGGRPADSSVTEVRGRPGATGVVSIVATATSAAGYVQVLPCSGQPGGSSNLNVDSVGQTIAGSAFVRFDDDGRACVFVQRSAHLVVDLQGYLTDGAFDDVVDVRLVDTRLR